MDKIRCSGRFKLCMKWEENKMNKKKRITTIIVAIAMLCMMSMTAFADTDVHISLPKNQEWTSKQSVSRTGNYSYVSASLDSV